MGDMNRYAIGAAPVQARSASYDPINSNPQIQAWYNQMRQAHPEDPGLVVDPTTWMMQDQQRSGYDYTKALTAQRLPTPQKDHNGQYRWDNIGKGPEYYIKSTLPPTAMQQTQQFEGFGKAGRPGWVYNDSRGIPTVGNGLNLTEPSVRRLVPPDVIAGKRPITREENDKIFTVKYHEAIKTATDFAGDAYDDMTPQQRASLVDMAFNLGRTRLNKFEDMKRAVKQRNWEGTADAMVDSKWYGQVGNRSKHHEKQFRRSSRVKAVSRGK